MIGFIVAQGFRLLLDWLALRFQSAQSKDLELLLLRQQLRILQCKGRSQHRFNPSEKTVLAILLARFKQITGQTYRQLNAVMLIVRPETVIGWHRKLVRRKWNFNRARQRGRPAISVELEDLIVQLAKENGRWGYRRISGELEKLGYRVSKTTIAYILKKHHLVPAPQRQRTTGSWRRLLNHYRQQVIACDFFTVETIHLRTVYVLFFIELSSRRILLANCTPHPTAGWVRQQARQVVWQFEAQPASPKALIHDRDTKFTRDFDAIFRSEQIKVLLTPYQAPNTNTVAERWVRTIREECLDQLLIINEAHLRRVLAEYIVYYNTRRPHQGIQQRIPAGEPSTPCTGPIRCRDALGGIIHDYYVRFDDMIVWIFWVRP